MPCGSMIADHAGGRPITAAVTEWNTTAGDWGPGRGQLWSLANALACSRYHNLMHRHCDLVQIACRSNLVNSFCSGCIQTDNHRLYKTPTYYAQQLYATLAGDRPLRIDSPLPSNAGPDLSATLSRRWHFRHPVCGQRQSVSRSRDRWISRRFGATAHTWCATSGSGRLRIRRTPASRMRQTALPSRRASSHDRHRKVSPVNRFSPFTFLRSR